MQSLDLFTRYFLPLYPPDVAADLGRARSVDANPADNPNLVAHLTDAAQRFVARATALFGEDLALDFSDASVHRLSALWTPARLEQWAREGAVGSPENELFNVIVHGAAYVGETIVRTRGARWLVRRPLWESRVRLVSAAGEAELAPFSWLLRSSSVATGDKSDKPDSSSEAGLVTLADRYRTFVEVPSTDAMSWPVWLVPRPLPGLKRPTYSSFYKYLRAHLVEIRDVGNDFPSAERFDELRFKSLAFQIVGEGRALVAYGMGDTGASAFWFGPQGFTHALYIPCDAGSAVELTLPENRVRLAVTAGGKPVFHESMWWGP